MTRTVQQLRTDARRIFAAGVAAVDPVAAVQRAVVRHGETLVVDGRAYDLRRYEQCYVIGAGKAGATMAQGLEHVLQERISGGAVTVKYGHRALVTRVAVHEAGHPLPDAAGVHGAEAIIRVAQQAGKDDLVFCVLSGGGSALLPAPCQGITLEDTQQLTSLLLACGASIDGINTLRKHVSRLKGGQLARAVAPAALITLVLSDVVGDRLDAIASGPTVPDSTTFADCLALLTRYNLLERIPENITRHLQEGCDGGYPETPKADDPVFAQAQTVVIGTNRMALQAARDTAVACGYTPLVLSSFVQGEAREVARVFAAIAHEVRRYGSPVAPPACILAGGETTVTLRGDGKGGRNQEWALAAGLDIAGVANVVVLSGGTDGTDGPTDAAGALADGQTVARAQALDINAGAALRRCDSYNVFAALDDLLMTGPTGTNVMDIYLLLVG